MQARTNFQTEDAGPLAAMAQLTTFVRTAREDLLRKPPDAAVNLPTGSPKLQALLTGENQVHRAQSQALFEAIQHLGGVLAARCCSNVVLPHHRLSERLGCPATASLLTCS